MGWFSKVLSSKVAGSMLTLTPKGLYCQAGNFHIDPSGSVENAVITHAHSDHARRGSRHYFCAASGVALLKARLGKSISAQGVPYGQPFFINGVRLSFHPAGHILGSAQVRIECAGEVWVASGDYKRDADPTCEPFESVRCDVFVTEATFGTPAYRWPKDADLGREIYEWWSANAERGVNSVLYAYSLGKTQRVLGSLAPHAKKPIYCHAAATAINDCYRAEGVKLAPTICLSRVEETRVLRGELFLVPQSFHKSEQASLLGDRFETAFASGWMAQNSFRSGGYDRGFVMSDHADWDDLVRTVTETGAKRIYVQHRGKGALVKHLNSLGLQAFPDTALVPENPDQLTFF
jgi:putative mRNA 3-end processing factor